MEHLSEEDIIYWMGWMMDSQARLYDAHLAILAALGAGEQAKELQQLHEQGKFLYPPDYAKDEQDDN